MEQVAASLHLSPDEVRATGELLAAAQAIASHTGFSLDEQAQLGLAAHLASLCRRLASGERVGGVDPELFDEVPLQYRSMAVNLVGPLYEAVQMGLDQTEVGLVALHFAAAHERAR